MDELERWMEEHPDQVSEEYLWDVFYEWGWFFSLAFVFFFIMTITTPIVLFINGAALFDYVITGLVVGGGWFAFWMGRPIC